MPIANRNERTLTKEITMILVIKLCAITLLWYAFYRDPIIPSMIDGMHPDQVSTAVLRHQAKREAPPSEGLE